MGDEEEQGGQPGENWIPGPGVWIVVYHHRYGTDVWPVMSVRPPSEEAIIADIEDWEPERDERIEICGPWALDMKTTIIGFLDP